MKKFILLGTVISCFVFAGFIYGQSASGSITACVKKNGAVFIIGDCFKRADCLKNEKLITWSIQGPKGEKGERGEKGDRGEQGPASQNSWDEQRIASIEARLLRLEKVATTLSLFEYYNTGDNNVNSVFDPKWEAQTFTPQITHRITKVKIKIYRRDLPGILSVEIRATDTEGKPSGINLASGTIDGNNFTDDEAGAWYEVDLGAGAILYSGAKYAIVLGNSASGWARWKVDTNSNYEGGTSLTSLDSGKTWVFCDGNYDTLFEEWGIAL